ncbi:MAG: VOC family protein [Pseudomonadota bacterium]
MSSPFFFGVGGVVSADIAVPNHPAQLAFYAQVLTSGATPHWREDLLNAQETPIIGLGERSAEWEMLPLQWMPHIQVEDVAKSVTQAIERGGVELIHGRDENGHSIWAGISDPQGAAFGIIPVIEANTEGYEQSTGTGHIAELSLISSASDELAEFYAAVVGWDARIHGKGAQIQLLSDGAWAASIEVARTPDETRPRVWILWLTVDDLQEGLERLEKSGGSVVDGSADLGRALVKDPQGIAFGLIAR